ncbi:hypothetical protein KSS87_001791 [Heliosperma pusillum]|nr:hypothetical protein KSS87_003607 [Heliosperma pusillum]KAH9619269.1 hypothetical protein KSS87_001791 [Heliosperma pusillum]
MESLPALSSPIATLEHVLLWYTSSLLQETDQETEFPTHSKHQ